MASLNGSQESLQQRYSFDCFNIARTRREKITFIVGAVLVLSVILSLMIAVIVLAVGSGTRDSCPKTACTLTPGPNGDMTEILEPTPTSKIVPPLICNTTQTKCNSPDCTLHAAELLYNMDENIDPCEDFFKYTCGRWLEEDVVRTPPFDQDNPFNELQLKIYKRIRDILKKPTASAEPAMQKAVTAYTTCMQQDPIDKNATIWKLTKKFGGWPILEGLEWNTTANEAKLDEIFAILPNFRQYTLGGALFTLSVSPDYSDPTQNVPLFSQPTPIFPANRTKETDIEIINLFWNLISKYNPSADASVVRKDVSSLLHLNDIITKSLVPVDPMKIDYTSMQLKDFAKATSGINVNWKHYLDAIFDGVGTFEEFDYVGVMQQKYFSNLAIYIKKYEMQLGRAIVNYEMLMILIQAELFTSELLTKSKGLALQQLTNPLPSVTSPEKWFSCVTSISDWFANAIAPAYEKLYMKSSSTDASKDMTSLIIKAFKTRLTSLEWLGEEAKIKASKKLDEIKPYYGYPQWAANTERVSKFYKPLAIGQSHLDNEFEYAKFAVKNHYKTLHRDDPENPIPWQNPLKVNAFYSVLDNSINILQSIMQPPVFDAGRLKVMNFGALGMVIGHEVTHGFDTMGRQFDGNGKLVDWMDSSTTEHFNERTKCFIEQYNKYSLTTDDLPGYDGPLVKIDGLKTVGENIADAGGIQNAYKAYKMWEEDHGKEVLPQILANKFSHDQLFFVSFANVWCTKYAYGAPPLNSFAQDTHSPAQIRVFGALSNFEEFSKAFNCKPSAAMVPSQRCTLW